MKKQLVLPAYIIVEVIYYFFYQNAMVAEGAGEMLKSFFPIYSVFVLANTYLLYAKQFIYYKIENKTLIKKMDIFDKKKYQYNH